MKKVLFISIIFISSVFNVALSVKPENKQFNFEKLKAQNKFEENKGQISDQFHRANSDVLFTGSCDGLTFHIKQKGISYQLMQVQKWNEIKEEGRSQLINNAVKTPDEIEIYRADLKWINSNPDFSIERGSAVEGFNNYYKMPGQQKPALYVLSYEDIRLKNIWNGIDVHLYYKNGSLEIDYEVNSNTDYHQIQFEIKGTDVEINIKGELILHTPFGDIIESMPVAFQNGNQLETKWTLNGNSVGLNISDKYNPKLPLHIDPPVRLWGTYFGGSGFDAGYGCALDDSGNVFLAGYTQSISNIATTGSHQVTYGGGDYDGFITKLNSDGNRIWSTYYGGAGWDWITSCSADDNGNVYVSGYTESASGIASPLAHQITLGSSRDAFLVKFNGNGTREWGTYYGGDSNDYGWSCKVDVNGDLILAGETYSTNDISTAGAHQTTFGGSTNDAFVVKFNGNGVRQWGTYYGGTGEDYGVGCSTDSNGNIFLTGLTFSDTDIATPGAHQTSFVGNWDAYLVKFNPSGVRQWATYYGDLEDDYGYSCAADLNGNIFMAGLTKSNAGIATPGSYQSVPGGNMDAYLVKFNSSGVRLWATYYGGIEDDFAYSCEVTPSGKIFIAGPTISTTGIATPGSHQPVIGGDRDAFVAKFHNNGPLLWGTYYGGVDDDFAYSCTVNTSGKVYIAGQTASSANITTTGVYQPVFGGGGYDAFMAKLGFGTLVGEEEFTGINFELYPNPSHGTFTINFGDQWLLKTIRICNVIGQEVYVYTTEENNVYLNLEQAPGIYFLTIETPNYEDSVYKIVVE
ncbi:MAG: SBBP repeat-containing protein [Bacteroidetes bacterium]|nr:SBBP repeat-containing protein [Bacteroidota bacterium]